MLADIDVNPDTVTKVTTLMDNHKTDIVDALNVLLSQVTKLLTNEGGLWLEKSSPEMSAQFVKFSDELKKLIGSINTFSTNFNKTVEELGKLDDSLLKQN